MKQIRKHLQAYTLVELMIATAAAGIIATGMLVYTSMSLRMITRNLAVNHSHDSARNAYERLTSDLRNAASAYKLVSYNGTSGTYNDGVIITGTTVVAPSATTDYDSYSGEYITTRANGVRFMQFAGGPYKIVGSGTNTTVNSTDITLQFEFGQDSSGRPSHGGKLTYVPRVSDKVRLPLISREFDIVTVVTAPTTSNTYGTVTLGNISGPPITPGTTLSGTKTTYATTSVGFNLYTTGTSPAGVVNPVTTGYFYQRVGYTVYNNQLRFHNNYPPGSASDTVPVRNNITSPFPFGLLSTANSGSSAIDTSNLRISLEAYDLQYSNRSYINGTTTLQSVMPSRTQPLTLNGN